MKYFGLYITLFLFYFVLSQAISGNLGLSWPIWSYLMLSCIILCYLGPFLATYGFTLLSLAIPAISCYLMLFHAILCFLGQSLAISGNHGLYHQVFSIRVQVEAGESKLWLFETFRLLFFLFFPGRVRGACTPKKRYINTFVKTLGIVRKKFVV